MSDSVNETRKRALRWSDDYGAYTPPSSLVEQIERFLLHETHDGQKFGDIIEEGVAPDRKKLVSFLHASMKGFAVRNGGKLLRANRKEVAVSWPQNPAVKELVMDQLDRPKGRYYATSVDGISGTGWWRGKPHPPEENMMLERWSDLPEDEWPKNWKSMENNFMSLADDVTSQPAPPDPASRIEDLKSDFSTWLRRKSDDPTEPATLKGKSLQGSYRDWNLPKHPDDEDDWSSHDEDRILTRAESDLEKALVPYSDLIRNMELWVGDKNWVEVTVRLK